MRTVKYILYIVGVLAMLIVVSCKRSAWDPSLKQNEVISLYQKVLTAAHESPERGMQMIDSLKRIGALPYYHTDLMRAKIYAQSTDYLRLDSAIIIGERLITLDEAKKDLGYRQDILEMLVNACRLHHDDEQTIHWSTMLLDLVRQQGLETEALRTEAEIGMALSQIGRTDEGLAKIDNVIRQLKGQRKWAEMDASIIALKRKVSVLDLEQRYSDIPPVAQMMLDLLADYEQHPDEFHDDSYREVTDEQRPGYIEFYRSKCYLYKAHAYAKISEERKANREESAAAAKKASQNLALYEQTDFAKTMNGREEITPTWRFLGHYDIRTCPDRQSTGTRCRKRRPIRTIRGAQQNPQRPSAARQGPSLRCPLSCTGTAAGDRPPEGRQAICHHNGILHRHSCHAWLVLCLVCCPPMGQDTIEEPRAGQADKGGLYI